MPDTDGEKVPEYRSTAVRVRADAASLRVTIPVIVAARLGIQAGDDIVFVLDMRTAKVSIRRGRPTKTDQPETQRRGHKIS